MRKAEVSIPTPSLVPPVFKTGARAAAHNLPDLVPQVGFEPTTRRSSIFRSTIGATGAYLVASRPIRTVNATALLTAAPPLGLYDAIILPIYFGFII